jgi:hypothetical protein
MMGLHRFEQANVAPARTKTVTYQS